MKNKKRCLVTLIYSHLALLSQFFISPAFGQDGKCMLKIGPEKAYFHDRVTQNGKVSYNPRKAYLITGDQVTINCQEKSENWIYVSFKNAKGVITRGFLRQTDLLSTPTSGLSKTEILRSLVGEYSLQSISGRVPGEGFFKINKKNEKWIATGTSETLGTVNEFNMQISSSELKELNSTKLSVSANLTIRLLYSGKIVLTIPFIESGMAYKLKNGHTYSWPIPESLNHNTTFIGNELFLYATDTLTQSEINFSKSYSDSEENIILISYDIEKAIFTINITGALTSTYKFK